jgi:hypothetical protein
MERGKVMPAEPQIEVMEAGTPRGGMRITGKNRRKPVREASAFESAGIHNTCSQHEECKKFVY